MLACEGSSDFSIPQSPPKKIKNGLVLWLRCYGIVVALLDVALCVGICWVVLGVARLRFARLCFDRSLGLAQKKSPSWTERLRS
jgi:hypothetical protein